MKHLLLLEDEDRIAREIVENLESAGYAVTHVKTVAQLAPIDLGAFQLLVLDWNLPDGEGVQVVQLLRSKGILVPVLMLTANIEPEFRRRALEAGVNDFLGKPFYFHEFKSRVEILLESFAKQAISKTGAKVGSGSGGKSESLKSGEIEIIKSQMRAFYRGQELSLSKKEFELLLFFVSHPDAVFSRNEILDAVWGQDVNSGPRTVDTHVLHLRKKINADLFQTVWSSGYRFVPTEKTAT